MWTKGVQMKGVLPCLVHRARRAGTRDFCPALAALVGPVQALFSSPDTISLHLSLSPSWAGSRAALPVSKCLRVSRGQARVGAGE
jgi:hypothetical protein